MATIDPRLLGRNNPPPDFTALPLSSQGILRNYDWATNNIEHLCAAVLVAQAEYDKLLPNDSGCWFSRDYNVWQGIDIRFFRLLNQDRLNQSVKRASPQNARDVLFDLDMHRNDDSDPDDNEAESIFSELNKSVSDFAGTQTRFFLVIRPLNLRLRRHVHAIAHFSHFGHMSIGSGMLGMILLSKNSERLPQSLKNAYKKALEPQAQTNEFPCDFDAFTCGDPGASEGLSCLPILQKDSSLDSFLDDFHFDSSVASDSSADSRSSFSSQFSGASGMRHSGSSHGRKKRKRQPGGFPCVELNCDEVFDRQCDLAQHQRSHISHEKRPYACDDCDRRFLFPKDLRRHAKKHEKEPVVDEDERTPRACARPQIPPRPVFVRKDAVVNDSGGDAVHAHDRGLFF